MLRLNDNHKPSDDYTGVTIKYRMFSRNAKRLHDLMHLYIYPRKWWLCICTNVGYNTVIDINRWDTLTESQIYAFKEQLNEYLVDALKCVGCPYRLSQFGMRPIREYDAGLAAILISMGVCQEEAEGCSVCSPWWRATMCLQVDLPDDTRLIIVIAKNCYQLVYVI